VEALQNYHAYEMLVVMGQVDLDEIVVLETHPAQWVSDAGGGEAGIELFWPPEFEGQESELEPRSLNFVTGTVADEQAPAPPDQVWMSHGLFEKDQGAGCLSSERICFGNVEAGERLLADLVFEIEGETIENSVLVTRDTTYMSLSRDRDELLSATLVVMDETGNRSDSVTLTRDDIPHNTIPAEYDDGSLRYCDAQRPEGEWHSTDEPLFEDDAGSSNGDDAGLVEAGTPMDASTPTEASTEPHDDGAAPEQPMTDATADDSEPDDSDTDDSDTDDRANADDPPNDSDDSDDSDDESTDDDDDALSDAGASPSGADDSDDDGCGCRAAGSGTSGSSPHWAVLFLAAFGVLRRRRVA
jgi:MYXO-CTERM domain-containing protein